MPTASRPRPEYQVQVEWLEPVPIHEARGGDFVESQPGSIAAAIISAPDVSPFVASSMCQGYARVHRCMGKNRVDDIPRAHSPNEHLASGGVYEASRIYALAALHYVFASPPTERSPEKNEPN